MGAGTDLMSQSDQIKLKSIGNCGVLITKGNSSKESILVDGIFGETPYFSPLPKEVKRRASEWVKNTGISTI